MQRRSTEPPVKQWDHRERLAIRQPEATSTSAFSDFSRPATQTWKGTVREKKGWKVMERCGPVKGISLWNNLNKEIKESKSVFTFKRTINARMFKKYVCLWLSWKINNYVRFSDLFELNGNMRKVECECQLTAILFYYHHYYYECFDIYCFAVGVFSSSL